MDEVLHTAPEFVDKKIAAFDWDDAVAQQFARRQDFMEANPYQEHATVRLDTQWPVLIVPIGDVHFGNVACDIGTFKRDIEMIRQTPNTFIVLMSNLIDNAEPTQFPGGMLDSTMTPGQQAEGMGFLVKKLDEEGKILGAVKSPCHEGWLWKNAGVDINTILFRDTTFPQLENGGSLHIQLPGNEYQMALFHQFGPFGSNFSKSHPAQQMQRLFLAGDADIVALAHSHTGEVMHTYYGAGEHRKDVVYMRTGSYMGSLTDRQLPVDRFVRDKRGIDGEPGGECVELSAHKREMIPFLKPNTAIEWHRAFYEFRKMQALGMLGMR